MLKRGVVYAQFSVESGGLFRVDDRVMHIVRFRFIWGVNDSDFINYNIIECLWT